MPQIRVVKVVFDTDLREYEIPAFRGAVIETVGREHVIFHNHLGDEKFHYKYPAIQYKREGCNASIICIKEGVDEIHHFFTQNSGLIRIGKDYKSLYVKNVEINSFSMRVTDEFFTYQIKKWLPVNGENFQKFKKIDGLVEQISFLERILVGNILSMAKGLDWYIDKPVEVKIKSLPIQDWTTLKQSKIMCFDLEFKTNVFLPYGIGLGKSSSIGYGTLQKAKTIKSSL